MELNINRKQFEVGSVVYFIDKYSSKNGKWKVSFGTVEEHYPSAICLQLYDFADRRMINGIPVKEFVTPSRWQKLPKNWSYDTVLLDLTWQEMQPCGLNLNEKSPKDILKAIELGILVKIQDNDYAKFETEISKEHGWRIVRKYDPYDYHQTWTSLYYRDVYATYAEAQAVIDEHMAEFRRQAALSDYDWSVEQIDHELNRWAKIYSISDEVKMRYREWLLSQDNVEDIEVRLFGGYIQWKYWKNKRWMDIEA